MKIKKLTLLYNQKIDETLAIAEKLAKELVKILREHIPDIDYTIGYYGDFNTICFYSSMIANRENCVGIEEILNEVITGYFKREKPLFSFDCPFGCFIPKDIAEQIKEKLIKEMQDNEKPKNPLKKR